MWEYVSALECAWVTAEGADAAVHGEGPLVFVWQHQAGHGGEDFISAAREDQWSVDCLTRMPFSPRAQRISLWNSFQPTEYWTLPFSVSLSSSDNVTFPPPQCRAGAFACMLKRRQRWKRALSTSTQRSCLSQRLLPGRGPLTPSASDSN